MIKFPGEFIQLMAKVRVGILAHTHPCQVTATRFKIDTGIEGTGFTTMVAVPILSNWMTIYVYLGRRWFDVDQHGSMTQQQWTHGFKVVWAKHIMQ